MSDQPQMPKINPETQKAINDFVAAASTAMRQLGEYVQTVIVPDLAKMAQRIGERAAGRRDT